MLHSLVTIYREHANRRRFSRAFANRGAGRMHDRQPRHPAKWRGDRRRRIRIRKTLRRALAQNHAERARGDRGRRRNSGQLPASTARRSAKRASAAARKSTTWCWSATPAKWARTRFCAARWAWRDRRASAIACILAGQVGSAGHLEIGDGAIITSQSGLHLDVPPGADAVRLAGHGKQIVVEGDRGAQATAGNAKNVAPACRRNRTHEGCRKSRAAQTESCRPTDRSETLMLAT